MRKTALLLGAAAIAASSFFAGRLCGPAPALAQAGQPGGGAQGGAPRKLDRPHDVLAHMMTSDGHTWEITIASAISFDVETVGGDHTFLRLTNTAGKLWYIGLDQLTWIEATPIGGGAAAPAAAPK